MSRLRSAPVSRRRVLVGALFVTASLSGLVAVTDWLRPPATGQEAAPGTFDSDPRTAIECEEPQAREGLRSRVDAPRLPTSVSSGELLDCPTTWDKRTVRYRGEVVGGVLQRRDGAWLQVNDDAYATEIGPLPGHRDLRGANAGIGVWIPDELVERVGVVGGPHTQGDFVEITGIYYRVDPKSREVAIIRAHDLQVARRGQATSVALDTRRVVTAAIVGAIALGFLIAQWRQRRRFRR